MNSPYYFGGLLGSAEGFLGWADDLAEKRKILLTRAAPILPKIGAGSRGMIPSPSGLGCLLSTYRIVIYMMP